MSDIYEQSKFLLKWRNAIDEAIFLSNTKSNRYFHIQNQQYIFEMDGRDVCNGVRLFTFIRGIAVDFWLGLSTPKDDGNGELILYLYSESNSCANIEFFRHSKLQELFTIEKVGHDIRLKLTQNLLKVKDKDKAETVQKFFTNALDQLSQNAESIYISSNSNPQNS